VIVFKPFLSYELDEGQENCPVTTPQL